MLAEFAERITKKREVISQIAHRCKEISLRETMVICERCKQDLAPLKTFAFEDKDLHYAKCVFGAFRRVSLKEVLESQEYQEDHDFVTLHKQLHDEEMEALGSEKDRLGFELEFSECRKKHIVGIVKKQKYYLTDISPVLIMFPTGIYENWDSRYFEKGYKKAFEFE